MCIEFYAWVRHLPPSATVPSRVACVGHNIWYSGAAKPGNNRINVPNGLPEVVAQRNTLPTVPETIIKTDDAEELAVAAINATVGTMRDVHEKVDAEDSASADILNDYIRRFEQQAWFIRSQNGQA